LKPPVVSAKSQLVFENHCFDNNVQFVKIFITMTWSTIDGKEHTGVPNNKMNARQRGLQKKREMLAERKRKRTEQLAEARAKKKLRESIAEQAPAVRTKDYIQKELAANLLLLPNYQVQFPDVFDLGNGRDKETHNVGDVVYAAKPPPSNDMHWATIIEVNAHVFENPSLPTLYDVEFDDGVRIYNIGEGAIFSQKWTMENIPNLPLRIVEETQEDGVPIVDETKKTSLGEEAMVAEADEAWKPFWYHPSLGEDVEEASMIEETTPVTKDTSTKVDEPEAWKPFWYYPSFGEETEEASMIKEATPVIEELSNEEHAAEETKEDVRTPSPGKAKAGSRNKPRTFKTSRERHNRKRHNRTDGKDKEEEEEEEGMFDANDDDSTSTYNSSSSTETEPTPSKKNKKTAKPASQVSPLKGAVKAPPAAKDNAAAEGEEDRKRAAQPDRKKDSDYFMAMFPDGSTHKKPEDTTNPNAGTRATEKKRLVGQHPATERQQMDDKVRKQFALSCKHDVKLMPMMTPISKMDGFLETAAERSDLESIAQETDWKSIIPIKGLYTEMKPNSGGSVAVQKHLKPKLGFLVPSKKVGVQLFDVLAKAVTGGVQLEFYYEAFGEKGLTSMIEPKSKAKAEAKDESKPAPIPEVKFEDPSEVKTVGGKEPSVIKKVAGEEHAEL